MWSNFVCLRQAGAADRLCSPDRLKQIYFCLITLVRASMFSFGKVCISVYCTDCQTELCKDLRSQFIVYVAFWPLSCRSHWCIASSMKFLESLMKSRRSGVGVGQPRRKCGSNLLRHFGYSWGSRKSNFPSEEGKLLAYQPLTLPMTVCSYCGQYIPDSPANRKNVEPTVAVHNQPTADNRCPLTGCTST